MAEKYRIKFTTDLDARFEECNGESRPLTEEEYRGNEYHACPKHPRTKVPPKETRNGIAWCGECGTRWCAVPYEEYRKYQGNPNRHVYLLCIVQRQCKCCQSWLTHASLGGIDLMDDSPEYRVVPLDRWMEPATGVPFPADWGYLAEVAQELLAEVTA